MRKIAELNLQTNYPKIFVVGITIFIADGGDFSVIDNDLKLEIKHFEKRFEIRNLSNQYFYLDEYSGEIGHLFSVKENKFVNLLDFVKYEIRSGTNHFCIVTDRNIPHTILYDLKKKEIIWQQEKYVFFQIFENTLIEITNEKGSIIRYDFKTGSPLWQYNLPENKFDWMSRIYINNPTHFKAEIQRLLGVHSGIVWIVLNSGRLLGINVESGEMVFNISQPNKYQTEKDLKPENEHLYYGSYLQLDAKKGILFGLKDSFYYELDLKNPSETYFIYDISESCNNWQIAANMAGYEWSWQDDEIFFGETNFANRPAKVGIFNRDTKKITWTSSEFGEEGVFKGIQKIDYADNRLYVLDGENTLHIFERDEK